MPDCLLHRVAQGDPRAVNELMDRYGGLVYSLARKFAYEPSDLDDAVQDVFVALWQTAQRFDPALGAEETFVSMVARRRLIDRRRRAQRRDAHRDHADVAYEAAPDAASRGSGPGLADRETLAAVDACFALLRAEQQRCLRLCVYQGLSHEEAARVTGWPLGTVKTHVRRGLIALRDALAARGIQDARPHAERPVPAPPQAPVPAVQPGPAPSPLSARAGPAS